MKTRVITTPPIAFSDEAIELLKVTRDFIHTVAQIDFEQDLSEEVQHRMAVLLSRIPQHTNKPGCVACQVLDLLEKLVRELDGSEPRYSGRMH